MNRENWKKLIMVHVKKKYFWCFFSCRSLSMEDYPLKVIDIWTPEHQQNTFWHLEKHNTGRKKKRFWKIIWRGRCDLKKRDEKYCRCGLERLEAECTSSYSVSFFKLFCHHFIFTFIFSQLLFLFWSRLLKQICYWRLLNES